MPVTPCASGSIRKGQEIGEHRVDFDRQWLGADLDASRWTSPSRWHSSPRFKFRQQAVDHLARRDDGALRMCAPMTTAFSTELRAEHERGKLHVEGPAGALRVPLGLMTDTCFWNPRIVELPQIIDAGKGNLARIDQPAGRRRDHRGGWFRPVRTKHFRIASSGGRSGDIWYDARNGRWVQSTIHTRGEVLDYRAIA